MIISAFAGVQMNKNKKNAVQRANQNGYNNGPMYTQQEKSQNGMLTVLMVVEVLAFIYAVSLAVKCSNQKDRVLHVMGAIGAPVFYIIFQWVFADSCKSPYDSSSGTIQLADDETFEVDEQTTEDDYMSLRNLQDSFD